MATRSRVALYATAVVYLVLAMRQLAFVNRYAVDVLYWDGWDFYRPMFEGRGWWASFDHQHGPHRQGLGGLWIRAVAPLTRWDTRYDALAVSGSLILAVPLGVWLTWRCGVRGWPMVAVPVVYLNARQYQMFVASANPAHGALPVLLVTALALAWFIRRTRVRLALIVGLTFCCIFTGFGLFAGLVVPVILAVEAVQARRAGRREHACAGLAALGGVGIAWAAFAVGYHFTAASDRFRFPYDRPVEYLWFIGTLFGNYAGVRGAALDPGPGTIGVGLAIAVAVTAVMVREGTRLVRRGVDDARASAAVFLLAAFAVLYAAQDAIGRTPEGWRTAANSRYVTLCIPAGLAVLLHLSASDRPWFRRAAVGWGLSLAVGTVSLYREDLANVEWAHDGCMNWRAAYLATHDELTANRMTGFGLFPRPVLADRLRFLESHRLNLFAPGADGAAPVHAR
jgi:hypothetical protein